MAYTSRGIWYPATSDTVRPASRDFKDSALTANAAIDAAVQEAKWTRRALTHGENLNDLLEPGVYWSGTYSLTNSLLNRPEISDAVNRVSVEVITDGNGGYQQTWVTYNPVTAASSPVLSRRRDDSGAWTEWESSGWVQRNLNVGEDMNNVLSSGLYVVRNYTVANSLLHGPTYRDAVGKATVEVTTDGAGSYLQVWSTLNPAHMADAPVLTRRRDEEENWTPWYTPNEIDPQPYAGMAGVASHQSQEGVLRLIAGLSEDQQDPWRWHAPVGTRTITPTHEGSGQAIHPSVMYFPDKWNGWHYWMAMTPYPWGNEAHEDPEILVSDDGDTWQVPAGLTNPLDDQPGAPGPYNSDANLVMLPDGRMMVTWRMVDRPDNNRNIFYQRISSDGVTWSPKQVLYRSQADQSDAFVSQSLVRVGDGWRMYGINLGQILYYESSADIPGEHDWGPRITCSHSGVSIGRRWWHVDVQHVDGQWWMLVCDIRRGTTSDGNLYLGVSDDGHTWNISPTPVVPKVGDNHDTIYKSGFAVKSTSEIDIWYSGYRRDTQEWGTYRTTASRVTPSAASLKASTPPDTGWRNISGLLNPGWTGTVTLRREDRQVYVEIIDINAPAEGSRALVLPNGFRPHRAVRRSLHKTSDNQNVRVDVGRTGYIDIHGAENQNVRGYITLLTDNDFPSTYPGTPE